MQSVILILGKENRLLAGAIGTVFCFICELTQLINTIPGTFDVRDLAMEGIAGFLVILSYSKMEDKKYEKGIESGIGTDGICSHGNGEWLK